MQSRSHFPRLFSASCAIGACLLLVPTAAGAQSLLEAWVFAQHRALIPIDELKETSDGTLVPPDHPEIARDGMEIWSVLNKRDCVIRRENPQSGTTTEYYLNNMSAIRPTIFKADGSFQIGLIGDKPVHCQYQKSEKHCEHFATIVSSDRKGYRAIDKALNHIYANFCRRESAAVKLH